MLLFELLELLLFDKTHIKKNINKMSRYFTNSVYITSPYYVGIIYGY